MLIVTAAVRIGGAGNPFFGPAFRFMYNAVHSA